MILDLSKIQVKCDEWIPTKNPDTRYERGKIGCISPEFLSLLIKMNGNKVRFDGYDYLAIQNNGFVMVLREKCL